MRGPQDLGEAQSVPPSGTVTFLMTDIEGSTRQWELEPEAMARSLARHDELFAEIVARHEGTLVKTRGEGDSTFSVFRSAAEAVRAAIDLQLTLGVEAWPTQSRVRVRMALHTGEAEFREGDYFGQTINRCARLRAVAHGEQTVMSLATGELVRDALPDRTFLRELGLHRLKDLSQPEHVFQLCHADLPVDFPPLRSLDVHPHNLPAQLTNFVGREEEMEEVRKLVSSSRLATLTGSGGAGKTRLALQVAAEVADEFPDGVWLTELGPVEQQSAVAPAVAAAVRIRDEAPRPVIDVLREHLITKRVLLVLDNCEQVLGACAALAADLLVACPGLQVLATSREPLGVPGEAQWRVPSLALPPSDSDGFIEAIASSDAVRLFCDRASLVSPHFQLTSENVQFVTRICRRLDGIPLAIELAAARVRALTAEQIAGRLDDRFRLLTGGARTAPPRQQTLRGALDSSYELLTDQEALLFRRLAVFAGTFSLEAVEGICVDQRLDAGDVLDLLASLVDKSLVVVRQKDSAVCYQLLETMRAYALDKLTESSEQDELRNRHVDWYAALLEQSGRDVLEEAEQEHDNVRVALQWALADGRRPEQGVRLAASMLTFWQRRGYLTEGRGWLEHALALSTDFAPPERLRVLGAAADLAFNQGDHGRARGLHEEALSLARESGAAQPEAAALRGLGALARAEGDPAASLALHTEALAKAREIGDKRATAESLTSLGVLAWDRGDYEAARSVTTESLDVLRSIGDDDRIMGALTNLGAVRWALGEYAEARSTFEETLALARRSGDRPATANALINLGLVASDQGDLDAASALLEEAIAEGRELERKQLVAMGLHNLGRVALARSDHASAEAVWNEALAIHRELGDKTAEALVLGSLGNVALARGEHDAARGLYESYLAVSREQANKRMIAFALEGLAFASLDVADPEGARAAAQECLSIRRELSDRAGSSRILGVLGLAAIDVGHLEAAQSLLDEADEIAREVGEPSLTVASLQNMGRLARAQGDEEPARRRFEDALDAAARLGDRRTVAELLEALGGLTVESSPDRSAFLYGAAQGIREAIGYPVKPRERDLHRKQVEAARTALGQGAFDAVYERSSALTTEEIVEFALGGAATVPSPGPQPEIAPAREEHVFRREGQYWTIEYSGDTMRLKDAKGLRHLALLLARPGSELHVLDMVAAVEGRGPSAAIGRLEDVGVEARGLGDAGAILDAGARAAYKRRIEDLEQQIEEAEAFSDPERAAMAREEMDALLRELAAGVGLGGRERKASSAVERARWSVTRAVKTAVQRIAEENTALGEHLSATVRTGAFCSYTPDPRRSPRWQT